MVRIRRDSDLVSQAFEFANAKEAEQEAITRRKTIGSSLMDHMGERRRVSIKVNRPKDTAKIRIKERESINIDTERLKKELGAKVYNKLTTPVLDEVKLEAAIRSGDVDRNVVSACTSEHTTRYLEVRFVKKEEA